MANTVVIIDDYDLIRIGLRKILEDIPTIKVVGDAKTGDDGARLVREMMPKIVLLDVRIPGINGLEVLRKILRYDEDIRVLAMAPSEDELLIQTALKGGARGFITKYASVDDITRAVRALIAGQSYLSSDIAQKLAWKKMQPKNDTPFDLLSAREIQVMRMIVAGQKVPVIADKLCLSTKTVNGYRYRIFEKLKINTDVELALLAVQHDMAEANTSTKND